jgi:hypothetical protein
MIGIVEMCTALGVDISNKNLFVVHAHVFTCRYPWCHGYQLLVSC